MRIPGPCCRCGHLSVWKCLLADLGMEIPSMVTQVLVKIPLKLSDAHLDLMSSEQSEGE